MKLNEALQSLVILGCHRSGTSMLAGLLEACGGKLPSGLMRPALTNRNGFNESWLVVDVNESILKSCDIPWDYPEPTPRCIEKDSFKERFIPAVQTSFSEAFGSENPLTGAMILKDPRMCRTFPIWENFLTRIGLSPTVVIPVRNPFDVIRSLETRDGMEPSHACFVWIWHIVEAVLWSNHLLPRFVLFEGLLENPALCLKNALGLEIPSRAHEVVRPDLNHGSSSFDRYPQDAEPFRTAIELYRKISMLNEPDAELLDEVRRLREFAIEQNRYKERRFRRREKRLIADLSAFKKETSAKVRANITSVESCSSLPTISQSDIIPSDKIRRMQNSFSWKVTAPLRCLRRILIDPVLKVLK
jgi:hypothetical protein